METWLVVHKGTPEGYTFVKKQVSNDHLREYLRATVISAAVCVRACVCLWDCVCACARGRACVRARVRARVCVCDLNFFLSASQLIWCVQLTVRCSVSCFADVNGKDLKLQVDCDDSCKYRVSVFELNVTFKEGRNKYTKHDRNVFVLSSRQRPLSCRPRTLNVVGWGSCSIVMKTFDIIFIYLYSCLQLVSSILLTFMLSTPVNRLCTGLSDISDYSVTCTVKFRIHFIRHLWLRS